MDATGADHNSIKLLYDKWLVKLVLILEGVNPGDDGTIMIADPHFDMARTEVLKSGSIVSSSLSSDCFSNFLDKIFIVESGVFMSFPFEWDITLVKYSGGSVEIIYPFLRYTFDQQEDLTIGMFTLQGSVNFMIEAGEVNYHKVLIHIILENEVDTQDTLAFADLPVWLTPPTPAEFSIYPEGAGN
jgi:hypothetical protein